MSNKINTMCEIVKNILILFLLCHPNVQAEVYEAQNGKHQLSV